MPRPRELLIAAVLAVTPVAVLAADAAPRGRFLDTEFGKSKDPIVVTSDRLEYDYRSNVVVYRGAVQATQGEVKITSDTLTVTFANAEGGSAPKGGGVALGGSANLREIVAVGTVRIENGDRWATGGRAVFDQSNRTLVLSESPVLHDGANEVIGDRIIVYLDEDRSVVEGGRKRVKAVLYPDKNDTPAAKADKPNKKKADKERQAAAAAAEATP